MNNNGNALSIVFDKFYSQGPLAGNWKVETFAPLVDQEGAQDFLWSPYN